MNIKSRALQYSNYKYSVLVDLLEVALFYVVCGY